MLNLILSNESSLNFSPQMQMLQGLSGLSQAQGGLTNPLLYYTYYTQVLLKHQTVPLLYINLSPLSR